MESKATMRVPGTRLQLSDLARRLKDAWEEDDLATIAGALTYFGFLSIFPFLLFLVALASVIITPDDAAKLVDELRSVAPKDVADILGARIESLSRSGSPGLLTVGVLGAIWAASGAVSTLTDLLNRAYDVKESRPYWKVKGLAILVTIAGAILSVIGAVLVVATPAVAHALGDTVGTLVQYLGYPVGFVIMVGALVLLYYVLPDVKQKLRFVIGGAVLAALLWLGVSVGFSIYVRYFGNYEATYGTLGGIIIFLFWMYLSSITVLLGAEVNAIVEHASPHGKPKGERQFSNVESHDKK